MHVDKCLSKSAVNPSIGSIEIKCYLQIVFHKIRMFLNYLEVLFKNKKLIRNYLGVGGGGGGKG